MTELGIAITAYRPAYLAKLLSSLEAQTDLDGVRIYLYQEGSINRNSRRVRVSPADVNACLRLFVKADLPNKELRPAKSNLGTALNQLRAWDHTLLAHERMLVLEEDVVLTPDTIRVAKVLLAQYEDAEDVGAIRLSPKTVCRMEEATAYADALWQGEVHWFAVCGWRHKWKRVRRLYDTYVRRVRGMDYLTRDHVSLLSLLREQGTEYGTRTSQDVARATAFRLAGYRVLSTVVHRVHSTGVRGVHFRPKDYRRYGFANYGAGVVPGDDTLSRFREVSSPDVLKTFQKRY